MRRGRAQGRLLGPNYLEVRYENLVQNPSGTLNCLSTFVDRPLDYAKIQKVGIGSVSKPNTSFASDLQEQGFQPVARWKCGMSEEQLGIVEALVGETLEELGYKTSALAPVRNHQKSLQRMKSLYHSYFNTKFILKSKTALGRAFVSRDLSWA